MMRRNFSFSSLHLYTISFYMCFLFIGSSYGSEGPYTALPSDHGSQHVAVQKKVTIQKKTTIVRSSSHGTLYSQTAALNNSFSSSSSDDSPPSSPNQLSSVTVQNGTKSVVAVSSATVQEKKPCCRTKVVIASFGLLLCSGIGAVLYMQARITQQAQGIGSGVQALDATGGQLAQSTTEIADDVQWVAQAIKSFFNITRSHV